MESFFVILYPLVTGITILGYLPQIRQLLVSREVPVGFSLSSWYLWTFAAVLSFGYALFHVHDLMFTLTSAASLILLATTTGLLIFRIYGGKVFSYRPGSY